MAALASGIFNHAMTAAQALTGAGATPMSSTATDATGTSSTSSSSATISANDFLSLLVTEMKNQDPTATTDPNEYINQLVNVNSLEQLIDINQNLSTALGSSAASPSVAGSGPVGSATSAPPVGASPASTATPASAFTQKKDLSAAAQTSPSVPGPVGNLGALSSAVNRTPGNLSVPAARPAAQTIAHALDGQYGAR